MSQETISKTKKTQSYVHLFLETSLALSSSLVLVVTSSLRSSRLSRSCEEDIFTSSLPYIARKTSLLFLFILFLLPILQGRHLLLFPLHVFQWATLCLLVLCSGGTEAGSTSAIYNIHLGRHPDIPKLFRPPLSRPVPHILCLLLTLQRLCQRIPQPRLSFQVCFAPPSHQQNAFLFLSQHSPPHSRHLPGQAA